MTAPAPLPALPLPWRTEPYRLFFPLGVLLAWAGVLHWLLHSLALFDRYHPVFHSIAQVQGFLMCFALGFLFTAIPSRTGTPPPRPWQIAVGLIAPVLTTAAAWWELWAVSQLSWLVLVTVLIEFTVRRLHGSGAARQAPASFVWVPIALGMGMAGSLLIMVGSVAGPRWFWLHDLGRLFLLQGMFLGLVLGVGGMLLPLLLRGGGPPPTAASGQEGRERAIHVTGAALLAATFWIETVGSARLGLSLRALLILGFLLWKGSIARPPALPGLHRRLAWVAAWLVPLGYVLAAAFPLRHKAGLHVAFIGGFALMAFAVGLHVTLAHGGYRRRLALSPWPVSAFAGLLLAAAMLRAIADFDRARYFLWVGAAAASFLLATLFWGTEVIPRLLRRPRPEEM